MQYGWPRVMTSDHWVVSTVSERDAPDAGAGV